MAALNLFEKAQVIATPVAAAKKGKKFETEMKGLEMYALLDATEKAVASLKDTYRTVVEPQMTDVFTLLGTKAGKKPDNFTGTDGKATASVELRKRSSASGLNDTEVAALEKYKISTTKAVAQPERFVFNPAYLEDPKMMEAISKAITGIKGVPADLILKQPEVSKVVTTEDSIDEVFRVADPKAVRNLLSIVSTMALKPKYEGYDLEDALQVLHDQVQQDRLETEA